MSLKYHRVKQADLLLPAPLRWLTRAFSSVTLAVCLLVLVMLYGVIASVPIAMLALAGLYLGTAAGCGLAALLIGRIVFRLRGLWLIIPGVVGLAASIFPNIAIYHAVTVTDWFALRRAMVLYRLPFFEMTELEFYSWWPLKLVLCLFMLNLIWATIRRIEFKLVNVGVLTVHTGIITLGVGSILYGMFKVEGDTLLIRKDLGGQPVNVFYDATTPAIYLRLKTPTGTRNLMLDLPGLPRYNDYDPPGNPGAPGAPGNPDAERSLDIRLDQRPEFAAVFGPDLRASIPGFYAYGRLDPLPTLTLSLHDGDKPGELWSKTLVAKIPGRRAANLLLDEDGLSVGVEFLADPSEKRIRDLSETFDGPHGLIVEVPATGALPGLPPGPAYRKVYPIHFSEPNQVIEVGDTGYRLTIEKIAPYGMPFMTPGYEGASDTQATVLIEKDGRPGFRRIVMNRYPERSQDFRPAPPGTPGVGPMGRRTDVSPEINLTYIDDSRPQTHLIARGHDVSDLLVIARLPGQKPQIGMYDKNEVPIGRLGKHEYWFQIKQRESSAVTDWVPRITPRENRLPKEEGTFLNALLPVDLSLDVPASPDVPAHRWQKRLWLTHMRYPVYPDPDHHPEIVNIPGIGDASVSFSRMSMVLPYSITLENFEMDPIPGTDIPHDFIASLHLEHFSANGQPDRVYDGEAHLNNPLVVQGLTWAQAMNEPGKPFLAKLRDYGRMSKLKFSQTGWDPGDKRRPNHLEKNSLGRYVNQQTFTILGVGSNFAIHIVFVGACLMALGIPMAFYLKPVLVQRQKRKIQAQLAGANATDEVRRIPESTPSRHKHETRLR